MNKYLTELIGTFFLVLTIGLVVIDGTPLAPVAIGCALMVMVYMGGHISGGHYNPAVTLAVVMRGAADKSIVAPYWAAQIIGALLAAICVKLVTGEYFAPAPGDGFGLMPVLLSEILFTFALALVVLNAATAKETEGNSYFGLAIGFTVLVGAFAVGSVSGGAFNPAVGFGPIAVSALGGGTGWADLWIYIVGPGAGGALAAVVFKAQHPA